MESARPLIIIIALTLCLLFTATGCDSNTPKDDSHTGETSSDSSTDSDDTDGTQTDLEIFTWWVNPGEADALRQLVSIFEENFGNVNVIDMTSVFGDSHDAHVAVLERIDAGNPPEIYQASPANTYQFTASDGAGDNLLQPIESLFITEPWGAQYRPEIIEVATAEDGHIYSLPISVIRINTFFYNPVLVPQPPNTLPELLALCETLLQQGITPIAVTEESWTLGHILSPLLASSAGVDFYRGFFGDTLDFSNEQNVTLLESALQNYVDLMAYTNTNGADLEWQNAADLLHQGEVAMFIHPSWAKGYLTSLGWIPGIDFDSSPFPGTEDIYIYSLDGFVSFADSNQPATAMNFLRVAGSAEAQRAFNKVKGQMPTLMNVDTTECDVMSQKEYAHMATAAYMHYSEGGGSAGILDTYALPLYRHSISVADATQRMIQTYNNKTKAQ